MYFDEREQRIFYAFCYLEEHERNLSRDLELIVFNFAFSTRKHKLYNTNS